MKFQRYEANEEEVRYFVNDQYVGMANHDEHGWSGMDSVDSLFVSIAEALGAEVEDLDEEPSDD